MFSSTLSVTYEALDIIDGSDFVVGKAQHGYILVLEQVLQLTAGKMVLCEFNLDKSDRVSQSYEGKGWKRYWIVSMASQIV